MSGTARVAGPPPELINSTKISTGVPVAVSALAMDSVEGQRARPEAVMRFDLLKVVGSSPARRAKPEADNPARAARRSTAHPTFPRVGEKNPPRPPPGGAPYRCSGTIRRWTPFARRAGRMYPARYRRRSAPPANLSAPGAAAAA